jgi:hypothetical protein
MKRIKVAGLGFGVVLLMSIVARGLVMISEKGSWPADWPKSLEALREHARTIGVHNGTQENIYEITFSDRAEFEKAWPTLLSLKTPGAPLRIYKVELLPASGLGQLESNADPMVRIYGPPQDEWTGANGEKLKTSAPWPKELYGPKGELPEFVRGDKSGGKSHWVPVDGEKDKDSGFHYRARVDVDLVIDGKVIDLNRIALPSDTPIEDRRF